MPAPAENTDLQTALRLPTTINPNDEIFVSFFMNAAENKYNVSLIDEIQTVICCFTIDYNENKLKLQAGVDTKTTEKEKNDVITKITQIFPENIKEGVTVVFKFRQLTDETKCNVSVLGQKADPELSLSEINDINIPRHELNKIQYLTVKGNIASVKRFGCNFH